MNPLSALGKRKVTLDEIREYLGLTDYTELAAYIRKQTEQGSLVPVKSGGMNGKRPALFLSYRMPGKKRDYADIYEELQYEIVPSLSIDYYLAHPDLYEEDREEVLALNRYLKETGGRPCAAVSMNERSFEIWGREKYLKEGGGMRILKNLNLNPEELSIYRTTEPLAYYPHVRTAPQKVLFLENKDTFYSMRRHLLTGANTILGLTAGTLIYGAGKGICRSFEDYSICLEPYLTDERNQFFYFGDLDYEGIGIYESLAGSVRGKIKLLPFREAYLLMLKKAHRMEEKGIALPTTKEGQNRNVGAEFFSCFEREEQEEMKTLLMNGIYIPQEILTISDF